VRYLDYAVRNHPELMGQLEDDMAESETAGKALKREVFRLTAHLQRWRMQVMLQRQAKVAGPQEQLF